MSDIPPGVRRLESVDVVRGIIMIIMALDHTRDFFGASGASPTNLATTSLALFATRWVTYFCAPVFFLLTGTGAYLSLRRKSAAELARFLFTRGLWLIFLEIVVLRCLAYQFNVDYRVTMPDLAHYPVSPPPGWGYSLPVVYLVWAFVVVAMYRPCRWFAAIKRRRSDAWLSYL